MMMRSGRGNVAKLNCGPIKLIYVGLVSAALASCQSVQTPLPQILEYPIVADVEISASRPDVASCLYDEARKGDVHRLSVLPGLSMKMAMPDVKIIERPNGTTDVEVQFPQEVVGNAALYRLSGSDPTKVILHWRWTKDAEVSGEGRRTLYRAPHVWLEHCVTTASQ